MKNIAVIIAKKMMNYVLTTIHVSLTNASHMAKLDISKVGKNNLCREWQQVFEERIVLYNKEHRSSVKFEIWGSVREGQ